MSQAASTPYTAFVAARQSSSAAVNAVTDTTGFATRWFFFCSKSLADQILSMVTADVRFRAKIYFDISAVQTKKSTLTITVNGQPVRTSKAVAEIYKIDVYNQAGGIAWRLRDKR